MEAPFEEARRHLGVETQSKWWEPATLGKPRPTFSGALALDRRELWAQVTFRGSPPEADTVKVPRGFV